MAPRSARRGRGPPPSARKDPAAGIVNPTDIKSGLKEMVSVSRRKNILFTWIGNGNEFWLENYIPEIKGVDYDLFPTYQELDRKLGSISVESVEIPYDCSMDLCVHISRDPRLI